MTTSTRIDQCFAKLAVQGRAGLVCFITAGDPNPAISLEILKKLPAAGADVIELGMPFSDPMADGPAIQAASVRALANGMNLRRTLEMVRDFRVDNDDTPLVLMGYYNPIYAFGVYKFLVEAKAAGVDGLIIVDLPPEEDAEPCLPCRDAGLSFVRLATPTTNDARLPAVLSHASGFIYYVSIAGITGTATASAQDIAAAVKKLKKQTSLPVAVGFGIKTPDQAAAIAQFADGVVVGSVLVDQIAAAVADGNPSQAVTIVIDQVRKLATAVQTARAVSAAC